MLHEKIKNLFFKAVSSLVSDISLYTDSSVKGFYSMQLNTFYDLQKHTYVPERGRYFLFCTKDIHSKGFVENFVK